MIANTTNLSGGLIAVDTTFTASDLKTKLSGDYMTRGGSQTLTSNITAANDTYTFMGAKPSEIASISSKLDSSKISDKSLDGNFKTLKVMDASVVTGCFWQT
jgi:hypothetical protein